MSEPSTAGYDAVRNPRWVAIKGGEVVASALSCRALFQWLYAQDRTSVRGVIIERRRTHG